MIPGIFEFATKLIDRIVPDKAKAGEMQLALARMAADGRLAELTAETELAKAQISVNLAEAANKSLWVSGWRPYVGWICGSGLAYASIVQPLLVFLARLAGNEVQPPEIDTSVLIPVLLGILGLGGLRTYEKVTAMKGGHNA